jgi:thiol peroxidase
MAGLMSRAIVVVNVKGLVVYAQQVPDIGQEPDYESALNSLKD